MAVENIVRAINQNLFSQEVAGVYAILDGASVDGLLMNLYNLQPEYFCLYPGELKPDMAEVAPYLVHLQAGSEFTQWVIDQGWGNHWGIFVVSQANLRTLRQHFRKFIIVYSDGQPLYFRYYDPRVMRLYLPTCNAEELETIFGPVDYYLVESDDASIALRFQLVSGSLRQEKVQLGRTR